MKGFAIGVALMLAGATHAAEVVVPPPPTAEPDWSMVRKQAEALLKQDLFDPMSAQIEWDGGWRWGHIKPFQIGSKRKWGWLGCGSLNAKNRMGGYVGATRFYVLVRLDKPMQTGSVNEVTSECDQPNTTPLQAAFVDAPASAPALSVADELSKLAALRDKGVITQVEFEAQKAKLLAR